MMKNDEVKKLHANIPQLTYWLIKASISICLWGRATGKTHGPGSLFTLDNVLTMPRSAGGIVSTSYTKLIDMVIPGLVKGWELLGYEENKHYFIRKFPPEKLKWPTAYRAAKSSQHYISWYNGSGQHLLSMDRIGLSNAVELDYLYGDEAKFFEYEKIKEVLLAVRGNANHFGHLSNHGSILFTTDIPKSSRGKWLFEYEKEVDHEVITKILQVQQKLFELRERLESVKQKNKKKIASEIARFEKYLNALRKEQVYVSYASTIDNVHAIGLAPIKNFKRSLTDFDFQVSVLSKKIDQIENSFYAGFDEDIHNYTNSDHDFLDSLEIERYGDGVERDCRWDADLHKDEPLDIAFDHNFSINCCVIGQNYKRGYATKNVLYVEHPSRLKDLVKKINDYYKYHPTKVINYYYDHTSIASDASREISYADEVTAGLEGYGWAVNRIYIGQAPGHYARYLFWGLVFGGDDPRLPIYQQNEVNCEALQTAMQQVEAIQGTDKDDIKKDKKPEKKKDFPQVEAPHMTDANDTLWWGKFSKNLKDEPLFVGIMTL